MADQARILYIEDNEGSARLLEKRLSRAGYAVDTAPDGQQGLERCAARHYDAIIIDYNMPGLSGLQVIRHLAARGMTPPTIMLTGTGNEQIAVEALKLGAFDYVIKDIDGVYLDLLPTVVDQALKSRQLLEDKRHAEEALRESEERFRMLFEEAPDPYLVHDLAGNVINCNLAVESLIGKKVEDMIGRNYADLGLLAPNQAEKFTHILAELTEKGGAEPFDLVISTADGREVVIDFRMIPIHIQGQTQVLSIGHDITWRKQAEERMKAYIEQLETLSRIDNELTRRLDVHYVHTMALESMMKLSGANAGCISLIDGTTVSNLHSVGYPEDRLREAYSLENRSIAARVLRQRKAEWVRDVSADPDYCAVLPDTCSQISVPLISQERLIGLLTLESNRPDAFSTESFDFLRLITARIAVAIDNAQLYDTSQKQLSELKSLYEKVSQLEQTKTVMIRLAAHDLRNLFANITTKTYLLRKTLPDQISQKHHEYISSIDNSVARMQALIGEFLSLERIEDSTQHESAGYPINLTKLVHTVYLSLHPHAEEKGLVYRLSLPETPLVVRGLEAELQQVITNLIGNAIKYTAEGGTVDVVLQEQDGLARFEVIDTGYGIPADQQEQLFQPFFRVQTEETRSIEGTGLGLYLVKKLIERNQGEIVFYSEHDKGSTFGFILPLVPG